MGGPLRPGRIDVRLVHGDIIECVGRGFITLDVLARSQADIERIMATGPGPWALLRDGTAIEGIEPGLPIAAIRWTMRNHARVRASVVIARLPPLIAVAATYTYFVPALRHRVVRTRAEALRFLAGLDEDRAANS